MNNSKNNTDPQRSEILTGRKSTKAHRQMTPWTDTDTVLDLLSNRRRRIILYQFTAHSWDTVPIETLIDTVYGVEDDMGEVHPEHRARIRQDFFHCQLPRLESNGLVQYDWDDNWCRYLGDPLVESMLDSIVAHEFWC